MSRPPAAVATFGGLGTLAAKMGHGVVRFCDHVVAVIDEQHAGRMACDVEPYTRRRVPVVPDLAAAMALGAQEVVLGGAPPGGGAAPEVLALSRQALEQGLWLVSGLHASLQTLIGDHPRLVELRHQPTPEVVAGVRVAGLDAEVVLTVGSDCASGKMTTALEIRGALADRRQVGFVATGQTGMYIAGGGVPIDAVKADFMAGVVEHAVLQSAAAGADLVVVEGQGSLFHPAYSGVALGLLHGSAPSGLVFCHDVSREHLAYFGQRIGDIAAQLDLTRRMAEVLRPTEILAVSLMFPPEQSAPAATVHMEQLAHRLEVPVVSPQFGLDGLLARLGGGPR